MTRLRDQSKWAQEAFKEPEAPMAATTASPPEPPPLPDRPSNDEIIDTLSRAFGIDLKGLNAKVVHVIEDEQEGSGGCYRGDNTEVKNPAESDADKFMAAFNSRLDRHDATYQELLDSMTPAQTMKAVGNLIDAGASVELIGHAISDTTAEVLRAVALHGPMHSPHEGISVIREELEELWEHVRNNTGTSPEARKEAIQLAAMAIRYVADVIGE